VKMTKKRIAGFSSFMGFSPCIFSNTSGLRILRQIVAPAGATAET
jgi:hypothetical protein